jgi:hypothetical protein
MAEGLTGRTLLAEHHYWHASTIYGPEWAVGYLESPACDWTPAEIDFVDWVFNSAAVLKERAELIALREGLTFEQDAEKRSGFVHRVFNFSDGITDDTSKKRVRKIKNRWGAEICPSSVAGRSPRLRCPSE